MTTRKQLAKSKQKDLLKKNRKNISGDEKIRIVLEGIHEREDIAEICHKEGIPLSIYKNWLNDFIEAGKRKLKGEARVEYSAGVQELEKENLELKIIVAELTLEVRKLKNNQNISI